MYSIAVYGGLVLFGMFLLYDTQKIVKRAETHPVYAAQPYDPVNKYGNLFNPLSAGDAFKRIHTVFPQLKFDRN